MSVTIQIDNLTQVRADVAAKGAAVSAAEGKAVATEVSRLVQRHFRTRDQLNPHQYPAGGRRSHFWRKAAQSVFFRAEPTVITVHTSHQGVRLRYAGAPNGIRPVNAKALAIPANADSYGRLPSEIPGLRLVVFARKNIAALVQGATKKNGQRVMFWLVKHTKPIPADPTVLPPEHVVRGLAAHRLAVMRGLEK
jgi:hypothetical protein